MFSRCFHHRAPRGSRTARPSDARRAATARRRRRARDERGQRRVPARRRHREPDRGEGERRHGFSPIRQPRKVATPLPPLKPSQTGNRCPRKAPRPARIAVFGPQSQAISTAAVPLSASPRSVAAARPLWPVRSTLVAPILPEPICGYRRARQAREDHAERDRAEQVAERERGQEVRRVQRPVHRHRAWSGLGRGDRRRSCPADHGRQHLPSRRRLVERRVLGARAEVALVEHVGRLRIEQDEIGGRAGAQPSAGQPRISAGRVVARRRAFGSAISPAWTRRSAADSSVSRPTAPSAASAKGRRFVSTSCGL